MYDQPHVPSISATVVCNVSDLKMIVVYVGGRGYFRGMACSGALHATDDVCKIKPCAVGMNSVGSWTLWRHGPVVWVAQCMRMPAIQPASTQPVSSWYSVFMRCILTCAPHNMQNNAVIGHAYLVQGTFCSALPLASWD